MTATTTPTLKPVQIDWNNVDRPELTFSRFASRRSVVYGTKGMVSCSQPLAAEAGLEILHKGGNAADAAVAVSVALNVTEPSNCGIGGDAFCLFYDATTKKVKSLNGSGRSPAKLTLEYALQQGFRGSIPLNNVNSVTVPGAAAAWVDALEHFGNKNVTISDVFDPAIRLAEGGVPVSEIHSHNWQTHEKFIVDASANSGDMLLEGCAPLPGEVISFPKLAQTFREVATHGKDGFYKGRIAQAIVDLIQSKGGVMELEDLANHTSSFVDPISYTYANNVTVYECSPNGQGLTALLALGILEQMQEQGLCRELAEMEHNSPEYLHTLIEALRIAFSDTQWFITDPDFSPTPVEAMLGKPYLASRAKLFSSTSTNKNLSHGSPLATSDTVYFSVTDQWGNACSFIQSNYAGFGTGAIPDNCGFTLQNRGNSFVLDPSHPNCLAGGKRPYHTIIPALATRGEELFLSFGVMGAYMQPQGHVQVLLNILRGFSVQAALDAPRFCISPGSPDSETSDPGAAGDINSEIYFEEGIPEQTIQQLRGMGHDARSMFGFGRSLMGRGQVIQKVRNAAGRIVWAAGSDPRADGHAAPQI
ncbi:hypothetical protein H0H81_004179 [Sphagnurus paluster]|uniref:Gamma-glutamyltranspeptidase n=1 Tax=Sphagnurus paluster TaxID=117069 RepID=A0A9P7FWF7_9AGAR|nr:hypothetical protein H0H81_004179 [Sphagnurus paluster]